MPKLHKDARKLADAVNAAGDGWRAEVVETGAHAGLAYVVTHNGRSVARVSAHASVGALALTRAYADLRRAGCPLPHHQQKRKEADVPALTREEKRRSEDLLPRLDEAAAAAGGTSGLARAAAALLEEYAPELQFGRGREGSNPVQLADAQLRGMLSRKRPGMKENALESWERVLDLQTGSANGHVVVPDPDPAPPTPPEPAPDERDRVESVDADLLTLADAELRAAERTVAERNMAVELLTAQMATLTEQLDRADEKRKREVKEHEQAHKAELEELRRLHQEQLDRIAAAHAEEIRGNEGTVELAGTLVASVARLEEEVDRLRAKQTEERNSALRDVIANLTRLVDE